MKSRHEPNSPAWHKSRAYGCLISFAFLLIYLFVSLIPAIPLFLKLFVPYPALEDAEYWQGTVHVQGMVQGGPRGGIKLPRYFIDTALGRKEFMCGLLGRRHECDWPDKLDGAQGEIWHHPVFGTLQRRFVLTSVPQAGRRIDVPYLRLKAALYSRFNYDRFLGTLAFSLVPLVGSIFCWNRYRRHMAAARAVATNPVTS